MCRGQVITRELDEEVVPTFVNLHGSFSPVATETVQHMLVVSWSLRGVVAAVDVTGGGQSGEEAM